MLKIEDQQSNPSSQEDNKILLGTIKLSKKLETIQSHLPKPNYRNTEESRHHSLSTRKKKKNFIIRTLPEINETPIQSIKNISYLLLKVEKDKEQLKKIISSDKKFKMAPLYDENPLKIRKIKCSRNKFGINSQDNSKNLNEVKCNLKEKYKKKKKIFYINLKRVESIQIMLPHINFKKYQEMSTREKFLN